MHGWTWLMVASALASPVVVDREGRTLEALEGVADEVATAPDEVGPALSRWIEAGGDLRTARALLVAGGRRGCTGDCAPALLHAARDAANAGRDRQRAVDLVLDAVDDAVAGSLTADHVVTDEALGYAVRAATARALARPAD